MIARDPEVPGDFTERPPEQAAALPLNPRDGGAPVAVTGEYEIAALVSEPLARVIARVAIPAVANTVDSSTLVGVSVKSSDDLPRSATRRDWGVNPIRLARTVTEYAIVSSALRGTVTL